PAGHGTTAETLTFGFLATDADGDTATQTGTFTVGVVDDVPVVTATPTVLSGVNEADLPGGNDAVKASLTTSHGLGVSWGADDAAHPADASGRTLTFASGGLPTGLTSDG